MTRWTSLKSGKRTVRESTEEQPLVANTIITEYVAGGEGAKPILNATQRAEVIGAGQYVFQPYIDIQHAWAAGGIDIKYGFTVSGSGVLTIDTNLTTGKLWV